MKKTAARGLKVALAMAVFVAILVSQATIPALAQGRAKRMASAPFSAQSGDRIRVVLDNYGPRAARANIVVLFTEAKAGRESPGGPFQQLASSGPLNIPAGGEGMSQ